MLRRVQVVLLGRGIHQNVEGLDVRLQTCSKRAVSSVHRAENAPLTAALPVALPPAPSQRWNHLSAAEASPARHAALMIVLKVASVGTPTASVETSCINTLHHLYGSWNASCGLWINT